MNPPPAPPVMPNPPPQTPPVEIANNEAPPRTIPGSYGWPVVGPFLDRLNYGWLERPEKFFKKRMDKYKSTVFRTNVPPCFPFFVGLNPNVIAVLDIKSFSHLFDMEIIEKKNILGGNFMPSVNFTGGFRVCAYLDTTEEQHAKLKRFVIGILHRSSTVWESSLVSSLDTMWTSIDDSLSSHGKASLFVPLQKCLFTFLSKSIIGADPSSHSPELAESGYKMVLKWVAPQLLPTLYFDSPLQPLVEIFLHSFPFPFWLVQRDYKKLVDFATEGGKEVIQWAQTEFGLDREEATHNLLFFFGLNAFAAFTKLIPTLVNILGKTNSNGLQERLKEEVRAKCGPDGRPSFKKVLEMPLVQSFVYETLRLNPPVPLQFGRARKDFVLRSYDSVFEVKKGELLCGFQKLVMMDPNVFDDPETFDPSRFVGDKGRELLKFLYWSNGPQTAEPGPSDKQCPAKEIVVLTACVVIAHLFQRYESLEVDSSGSIVAATKAK